MPIFVFNVSTVSILNIFGVFLNVVIWLTLLVLDLVLYLCVPVLAIPMSRFSSFSISGIKWGCGSCVSPLVFQISFLAIFQILE